MPQLLKRIFIQILVLGLCFYFIWPPEQKIKFGKDLAGGTSLVYTVQVSDAEDPAVVIPKVVTAIKDRVDPKGLLEISVTQLGRDRIEITMPLPRDEVKQLRRTFETELSALGKFRATPARLESAFSQPVESRDAALREMASGNNLLFDKLREAATLFDQRAELDRQIAALPESAEKAVRDDLVARRAEVNPKYRAAVGVLTANLLQPDVLRRVLDLPTNERMIKDAQGQPTVKDPSQQSVKLTELLERYPLRRSEIEAVVSRYMEYSSKRTTLDDPQDLVRLLRGAGVLTFRIPVPVGTHPDEMALRSELRERGPANARRPDARWFKINQITNWYESAAQRDALRANPAAYLAQRGLVGEAYLDGYYALLWDTDNAKLTQDSGDWSVSDAGDSRDEYGRPAVRFVMDNRGAFLLGELTSAHVGQPMAVLLDDQIYTAPTLQSAISRNGQITGIDSEQERQYVIKVLAGGALQAKLSTEPISTSTLSPQLGADNLRSGVRAGIIAIIVLACFMVVYYFSLGVIAVITLVINAILIVGLMSLNHATYTMPGIAGVILTFGVAVDANVLIYERMREELVRGADLKTAVRLGFSRAFASIFDGNITNLIVCMVLGIFGSAEVRGFAITMSIGVLSTLFAGLITNRVMMDALLAAGWRKTTMFAMVVPGFQKLLTPRVDWMRLRYIFFVISFLYCTFGLGMAFFRGNEMLDTEFRGGTQVELVLKPVSPGAEERVTLVRKQVMDRLKEIAEAQPPNSELRKLAAADVIAINPASDGVTSDRFKIKTVATDSNAVQTLVVMKFEDVLEADPALTFTKTPERLPPTFVVDNADLGTVLGRSLSVPVEVRDYRGGVAVLIENMSPVPTLKSLTDRIERIRQTPTYSDTLGRPHELVVLEGDETAVRSAALLVNEPAIPYEPTTPLAWQQGVANREANLVFEALAVVSTPASVQNFSPSIAATFKAQAILATILSFALITVYIWIRFGSGRYAMAAMVALVHDVVFVLGLLALCGFLYENESTANVARALGILPFKIDLNTVAALLTVAGYSLNDTIIIMDRIRENRGKSPHASESMINDAINSTVSRTLITSGTTLVSAAVLYLFGGEGVRAFAFALFVGVGVGTYSSVAVAAPIVWSRKGKDEPDLLLAPAGAPKV